MSFQINIGPVLLNMKNQTVRRNSTTSGKSYKDFKMFWGILLADMASGGYVRDADKVRFNNMLKLSLVLLKFDLRLSKTECFTMTHTTSLSTNSSIHCDC